MRIRDAREGSNGTSDREAILTVWDVKNYASDFFREGKRYLVRSLLSFARLASSLLKGIACAGYEHGRQGNLAEEAQGDHASYEERLKMDETLKAIQNSITVHSYISYSFYLVVVLHIQLRFQSSRIRFSCSRK